MTDPDLDAIRSREQTDHYFGDPREEDSAHPDAYPHPSRVTVSDDRYMVTGLQPKCPSCPLALGHDGPHRVWEEAPPRPSEQTRFDV